LIQGDLCFGLVIYLGAKLSLPSSRTTRNTHC
jgi:hypothetical protein